MVSDLTGGRICKGRLPFNRLRNMSVPESFYFSSPADKQSSTHHWESKVLFHAIAAF